MYSKTIIAGNLTRDIELRYSQAGMGIAKTAIAASRKFTSNGEKKEEVMFIDITFFGRSAEVANQYLRKGSKILIEGRLNFEQWVDKNGGKRSKHSITVESMQMLDSKSDNQGQAPQNSSYQAPQQQQTSNGYNAPQQQRQQQPQQTNNGYSAPQQQQQQQQQQMPQNAMPEIDINEDEIPF